MLYPLVSARGGLVAQPMVWRRKADMQRLGLQRKANFAIDYASVGGGSNGGSAELEGNIIVYSYDKKALDVDIVVH